ncbi:hypothetical protein M430DRAFT_149917 [Amorphotheca resinae ATCC 22711]|uniref:Uncharacterized protein n=1 Tax=Amorphotheca resinae ATCC 22711 TaxID=857342 RepID=A0A2T3BCH6_AMORE|nr:hypothetical protein M430DRAFT_149917 [Amorphotheca resinae ATCC 22711]PSS27109.1 hypothetical protein M430DRAFT_149917 [Amorphotheca resinae ATCC 22711]
MSSCSSVSKSVATDVSLISIPNRYHADRLQPWNIETSNHQASWLLGRVYQDAERLQGRHKHHWTVPSHLRIFLLFCFIGVVIDETLPPHGYVLSLPAL